MKAIILNFLLKIKLDSFLNFIFYQFPFTIKLKRYELKSGQIINFVPQGSYSLFLLGNLKKFKIDSTSHLKSDTIIECSGGVEIGRYFHSGRGLTIFSANHNWKNAKKIPYDDIFILKRVVIKDFVWIGANVTILPGVIIEEGAIIAGGSVVTKNVNKGEIVGGNPARIINKRDMIHFEDLKQINAFH